MAHYSGQALYIEFGGVPIYANHRGLSTSGGAKIEDTTAGADTAESHIVLTTNETADLTVLDDDAAAGDTIRAVLRPGAQDVLTYGPEGNGAGKPKYSYNATITAASTDFPYDGVVEIKCTFTRNGDWLANYDDDPTDVF